MSSFCLWKKGVCAGHCSHGFTSSVLCQTWLNSSNVPRYRAGWCGVCKKNRLLNRSSACWETTRHDTTRRTGALSKVRPTDQRVFILVCPRTSGLSGRDLDRPVHYVRVRLRTRIPDRAITQRPFHLIALPYTSGVTTQLEDRNEIDPRYHPKKVSISPVLM